MARVLSPDQRSDLTLEVEKNVEGHQFRFQLVIPQHHWIALLRANVPGSGKISTNVEAFTAAQDFWNHLIEQFAADLAQQVDVLLDPLRVVSREWPDLASLQRVFEEFRDARKLPS